MACYKLSSCTLGSNLVVWSNLPELAPFVNGSVTLPVLYPGICFTVEEVLEPCDCGTTTIISPGDLGESCFCDTIETCYTLTNCLNPQEVYTTLTNLNPYVGLNVSVAEYDGCFTVGVEAIEECADSSPVTCVTPCSCYNCYAIKNCDTDQVLTYVTYTAPNPQFPNPSTLVGLSLGDLCFRPGHGGCIPGCYYIEAVESPGSCINATDWVDVQSYTLHDSCLACEATCYLLEPCDSALDPIIVNNNLQNYLNQVINVCIEDECNCYTVKVSETCDTAISIPNPTATVLSCEECNPCFCPPGFEQKGDICERIVTVPATANPTTYYASEGDRNAAYGSLGTQFYNNITALPFPLTESGNAFQDTALATLTTYPGSPINTGVWASGPSSRLNTVGIWTTTSPNPVNEWIGFTSCVNIPNTKTYCIGVAGDNKFRLSVDGTLIVQALNVVTFNFNYWHVFEITLTQGFHVFKLEGLNDGGAASFGAEVYDADSLTLQAITTVPALQAVTIFSTFDKLGSAFTTGENSGYTCPPGSVFNDCEGTPSCSLIEQRPFVPCPPTYKVVDCEENQPDYITNTNLSAYVNNGFYKVCIEEGVSSLWPAGCYCVSVLPANTATGTDFLGVFGDNFETCPDCLRICYILTDCAGIKDPIKVTGTNLADCLNGVVKIRGCEDVCWIVTEAEDCEGCTSGVTIIECFQAQGQTSACDLCNPPVVPVVPPLTLKTRAVDPGYKTPVCSPEYYDKVNCNYAEQVSIKMLSLRYGLQTCCEDTFDMWDIKKELLDLQSLKNPNLP